MVLSYFGFNQSYRARVMSGMTTHVKSATTKALKTMLFKRKFQFRINRPSVKAGNMVTGTTPR